MKVAAQTVNWGARLDNLEVMLDTLAAHGVEGVEFSQRPEELGDIGTLSTLLAQRRLSFVGLSGGTLLERMRFCGDALRPEYLYIEDWDEREAPAAIREGFVLALHPHLFKPNHRMEDVRRLMEEHRELKFLPDVAHLHIANEAPIRAITDFKDRLAAIHLKDWTPEYGRSSHRYARGFVELGDGIINFDRLFDRFRSIAYKGWLVFEQGHHDSTPEQTITHASLWLAKRTGRMLPRRSRSLSLRPPSPPHSLTLVPVPSSDAAPWSDAAERDFLAALLRVANDDIRRCYPMLAESLRTLLQCKLVIICSCSPAANAIAVLSVAPSNIQLDAHFLKYRDSLSSVALERQAVTSFDLSEGNPAAAYDRPGAHLGYQQLIKSLGLSRLVSVPVLNPKNPHQARLVINFFPDPAVPNVPTEQLTRLGQLIAQAVDSSLDERCSLAAASASFRAVQSQQVEAFLAQIKDLILTYLNCEAVTIFLVNESGDRLEVTDTTGIRWADGTPKSGEFYCRGEGLTGLVWERREPLLTTDTLAHPGRKGKSREIHSGKDQSYLCAPMLDARGDVVGIVRCRNKRKNLGVSHMFSEDDVAVLEAIGQAVVPHLQVLLSKERRAKALRRLTHELHTPLYAMIGAAKFMRRDLERRRGSVEEFFSEDYIADIEGWVGLMRRLLGNADFFRLTAKDLILDQRRCLLFADIFVPAIAQAGELLLDRGFNPKRVILIKFEEIPALWVDKNLFHQVAFNLLNNAIKYAHKEPSRFRVELIGRETPDGYEVRFCDWGPGIREEMKEAIFEEGVRSVEAKRCNVVGDGLGLWVARRIIEAHGGELLLTKFYQPTEFTIKLPRSLTTRNQRE